MSKIDWSGGFIYKAFGNTMRNFDKKLLLDLIVPFAKDILPKLETKATSVVIVKFERKMEGQEAVRAEKGFILSISKEDLDYILLKW